MVLVVVILFRIITPTLFSRQFKESRRKNCFLAWLSIGSLLNLVFLVLPLFILNMYRGCDENPRNRVTFYVNEEEEIMHVMPMRPYWNGIIESLYAKDYDTRFEPNLNLKALKSMDPSMKGPYFHVRYEFNFITFTFKYIGYLSLVELVLSFLHNIVLMFDYQSLENETEAPAGTEENLFEMTEGTLHETEDPAGPCRTPLLSPSSDDEHPTSGPESLPDPKDPPSSPEDPLSNLDAEDHTSDPEHPTSDHEDI
jgi:hypothetical protein